MLRIQRSENGEVVFTLSGQMDEGDIAELETLIRSEANGRRIVLDLKDLTLVGRDAISFLERCEAGGITLKNCAGYVREWITRQRRGSARIRSLQCVSAEGIGRRKGIDNGGTNKLGERSARNQP
jgi:hypothetical protein